MKTTHKRAKRAFRVSLAVILIFSVIQLASFLFISETAKADGPGMLDEWPMFRHDLNRSGNTTSRAPNTNNVLWTHQRAPPFYTWGYCSSPAVAGGVVYQGSGDNCVLAIDAETGLNVWNPPLGTGRITSSPTVANDHVFFGSYDRNIYCVALDKTVVWKAPTNDYVDSSPVVYNGRVYCGCGQGDYIPSKASLLYCLDEITGAVIWTFQANGQIVSSPTIANDMVIFGSYDENIYVLPAEDPTPGDGTIDISEAIWVFNAGDRVVSSAAVEDEVVYIGCINGKLFALPLIDPNGDGIIDTDEVIWEFSSGNEIWSSPGIANGRIFIGSHDYCVYALPKEDPNGDGTISFTEILWKYQTTDKIWSSPSIGGGKVFIASEDYTLWAFCEETGELIWNYIMPLQNDPFGSEYLYAQPTIVDGKIYIGNYDLTLYCFGDEDKAPPHIVDALPANNSIDIPLNSNIDLSFNETLCDTLITDSSITVQSSSGKYSTGRIIYNSTTSTLIFNPDEDFLPNERYTVILKSKYFQDYAGNPLDGNRNGVLDSAPFDDYIWYFNTSELVGHKPKVDNASVTPQEGYVTTEFEYFVIYTDEDDDAPLDPLGYIKIFIDDSIDGEQMIWANDNNTPYSHLLDLDYTNGELFYIRTKLDAVGEHEFYIECSDGSNTNRTPSYPLPTVLNSPPELSIPIQYVNEDEEHLLNLSLYVYDVDNDATELTFSEDSDYCEIIDGYNLSCHFTTEGLLSEVVNITVSDRISTVWQDVSFIINPVNDPPALKTDITELPSVIFYEDTVFVFDLGEYITDPDTPLELLQVTQNSINITPIGLTLYMLYPEPLSSENVTLAISDWDLSLDLYFRVTVLQGNDTSTPDEPPDIPPDEPPDIPSDENGGNGGGGDGGDDGGANGDGDGGIDEDGDGGEDGDGDGDDGIPDDSGDDKIWDDDELMFMIGLIIAIIIALILINIWMANSRKWQEQHRESEPDEEFSQPQKARKKDLPPPPPWMETEGEVTPSDDVDEPPPPDDEEPLPSEDEKLPPPDDEEPPVSDDEDLLPPEEIEPPSPEDENSFIKRSDGK
ncbi:MAG: PQQ-binding-like beta-propeller repeat protein [Thermoplasmata archaeon]|nr:MAG: PQQ-binding-like beta-propeller repeat protein [Thermoplasmata archaeon]